jgi:hypothetical protein
MQFSRVCRARGRVARRARAVHMTVGCWSLISRSAPLSAICALVWSVCSASRRAPNAAARRSCGLSRRAAAPSAPSLPDTAARGARPWAFMSCALSVLTCCPCRRADGREHGRVAAPEGAVDVRTLSTAAPADEPRLHRCLRITKRPLRAQALPHARVHRRHDRRTSTTTRTPPTGHGAKSTR